MSKELAELEKELKKSFEQWKLGKEHGLYDPFYPDGVNMNLIRNHIMYYKNEIEKICKEKGLPLPEIYFEETPPKVDSKYMARADEIRANAKKVLEIYEGDANFQKLKEAVGITDEKKKSLVKAILGHIRELKIAIEKDDLVTMRIHERIHERYIESAKQMVAELKEEDFLGQLSLF